MVTGSFADGFASPNRTSATAFPISVPRYHACMIAGTLSANEAIASGRPPISTTTTGFPVACTARTSPSCAPGNPIKARLFASALCS